MCILWTAKGPCSMCILWIAKGQCSPCTLWTAKGPCSICILWTAKGRVAHVYYGQLAIGVYMHTKFQFLCTLWTALLILAKLFTTRIYLQMSLICSYMCPLLAYIVSYLKKMDLLI